MERSPRLLDAIRELLLARGAQHVRELYAAIPDVKPHSIRARIYEHLGTHFRRVEKGIYVAVHGDAVCVVVGGDAWSETKRLPTRSIDALVTDPPYPWLDGILDIHTTTRLRMRWGFPRRELDVDLGLEIWRVLRDGAHAFFFVPAETASTRACIERQIALLEKCGLVFNKRFIWDRMRLGMGYNGRARYEGILFMSKGRRRKPCDLGVPDLLNVPAVAVPRRLHPAEKPVALLDSLIRFSTAPGDTVLDPFAGSCATGVAALAAGRNAVLFEKEVS